MSRWQQAIESAGLLADYVAIDCEHLRVSALDIIEGL